MKIVLVYLNGERIANQGVGCIASAILGAGYAMDFIDTAYTSLEEATRRAVTGEYDLPLLSASSMFWRQAARLAEEFSTTHKTVVLGGVHATMLGGTALRECPAVDYLCVGEGESFILDFLRVFSDCGDVRGIPNLAYRDDNGAVRVNPVRRCADLNTLAEYRYDLRDPASIVQPYPYPGFCYVYATRGCPYACHYCGNSRYLELYRREYLRTRDVDAVIRDLLRIKRQYPVQFFFFGDEMVVFNEEYVTELFSRMRRDVGLPYGCMARVERIGTDILDAS